ncbi:hypothetical protein [Sinimarinibacterium flocculans]|uniref:Uncharacterized protein n=1 Tax=Sinimarinibacterium flocculans TaxID=985250 RepID=A0A318E8P9_9GAMM|nr:hypothetical protein [Sinimarinibacterium flocculans]PXV67658.1 hypothetical protein C8D93_10510 [Sinimarinibacterium flocculans]
MNSSLPQETVDKIAQERSHFATAPSAFFQAWKHGVAIAGPRLFGDGTRESWERSNDKWDLCPNTSLIKRSIGAMSSGEKVFLAAMVSFYNSRDGGALLKRAGVEGLADLGGLDLGRRQVIAALILHYNGW